MYVILVYDIGEKRVGKMLKLCRQYLNWIQNSVFEVLVSAAEATELIVPWLKENGYQTVTVSELIKYRTGRTPKAGQVYKELN